MAEENENLGEDGRPMLRFDSMDSMDNKPGKEQGSAMDTDSKPRGEGGEPMLDFSGSKGHFDIKDRSAENIERAFAELEKEFGPGYEKAVKNAQSVLNWADGNYPKSLAKSGLGNYVPLISALNRLGIELQPQFREANQSGAMKEASLKAFHSMAREKINKKISEIESEYATKHGGISR